MRRHRWANPVRLECDGVASELVPNSGRAAWWEVVFEQITLVGLTDDGPFRLPVRSWDDVGVWVEMPDYTVAFTLQVVDEKTGRPIHSQRFPTMLADTEPPRGMKPTHLSRLEYRQLSGEGNAQ